MISVADRPKCVQSAPSIDLDAPYEPTAQEWAAYCDSLRTLDPPRADPPSDRASYLPTLHYIDSQIAWHRDLARRHDAYEVVVTALQDLKLDFARTGAKTVADLAGSLDGIDLDAVTVPEFRASALASTLDEQAEYYLSLDTSIGRLIAWAILTHSELAEACGADTVREYFDADDDDNRAAFVNAFEEVFGAHFSASDLY